MLILCRQFSTQSAQHRTQLQGETVVTSPPPIPKELPTRSQQLDNLRSGKTFDVLVIGGGATGAGTALDAATRGLNTAMIEKHDFGGETSARSTKLVWAGVKYLASSLAKLLDWRNLGQPLQAYRDFSDEFHMVMGCQRERKILLENNPHLTNWVPIAIPVRNWVEWPPPFGHSLFALAPVVFPLVFKFYDSLSGFTCPPSHIMGPSRARRKFPQLADDNFKYAQVFYEGQHNDARTATCLALTAAQEGATVANHTEMIDLIRDDSGKAIGIQCRDNLSSKEFSVYSKSIIFCGGPFTDGMRKLEQADCKPAVQGGRGTHIVLPGYYSPRSIGMLDINTSDGRFLFFLPWEGHTLVGTTDSVDKPVSTPEPPEREIDWLLKEVETYLSPELQIRRSDVLSAWQGFRPLAVGGNEEGQVSRDHVIATNPQTGITYVTGGKWTTYREMAEQVLDLVIEQNKFDAGQCVTADMTLRGGIGYTKNLPIRLVQELGLQPDCAEHLASTYGVCAYDVCRSGSKKRLVEGFPYLEGEVDYACRQEMACTLQDMLSLRFRLAYLDKQATLDVVDSVANLMQLSLGWSRREKARQIKEAVAYVSSFGGPVPNQDGMVNTTTLVDVRELLSDSLTLNDFVMTAIRLGIELDSPAVVFDVLQKDGKVSPEDFVEWWKKQDKTSRQALGLEISEQLK